MNKKIAAVAVAGLFAAPAVALAQSSVTISGTIKSGYEFMKIGNYTTGGPGAGARGASSGKDSTSGVVDDSSRLLFNVREDLGGGLSAIVQLDMRIKPDDNQGAAAPTSNIVTGNSHIGLQSSSWGRIFFGRQDLHYFNTSFRGTGKGSLRSDTTSLLSFAGAYGANGAAVNGGTAVAGATRTQNVVHYTTPNWSGFTGIVAYSSNPTGFDADIGNVASQSIRRGHAWNLNPNYAASNWQVGYSYWRSKPDAGIATAITPATVVVPAGADQRGHRLYGNYVFGFGLDVGLAWDNTKLEGNTGAADGATLSKRTVWSIPLQYSFMGKHQLTGAYTWAKSDKASPADGLNTKANMWSISYAYDLSKRTSVALTYARISNQSNAGYTLFTTAALGVATGGTMAGEDPKMFGTTIRHAF